MTYIRRDFEDAADVSDTKLVDSHQPSMVEVSDLIATGEGFCNEPTLSKKQLMALK